MQLVTIDDSRGGSSGARLRSGEILHFARAARPGTIEAWFPTSILQLLEGGDEAMAVASRIVARADHGGDAREFASRHAILPPDTRLLAPIPFPRMILAAGLAYRSHLAEMSNTPAPEHPTAFTKAPSSVGSPGAALTLPLAASGMVDYEGELACIFGRTCHAVQPGEALSYIAGYTCANDLSARDWARRCFEVSDPWQARLTWEVNLMGKQFPGFTPLGPALVTPDELGDLDALRLSTRVNGVVVQEAPIGDMIFPLAEVISHLSRWYTFQPGDILLSGTPAGVGMGRKPPLFLKAGDQVEVEIDRIGTLITPVIA